MAIGGAIDMHDHRLLGNSSTLPAGSKGWQPKGAWQSQRQETGYVKYGSQHTIQNQEHG